MRGKKHCKGCRDILSRSRRKRAAASKSSSGTCLACLRRNVELGWRMCVTCTAKRTEQKKPHLTHDLHEHARYIALTRRMDTQCELTGLSLLALTKIGDKLSVDRIDPERGYVAGNMRTIALSINRAMPYGKMGYAAKRLQKRLARIRYDKLSKRPHSPGVPEAVEEARR